MHGYYSRVATNRDVASIRMNTVVIIDLYGVVYASILILITCNYIMGIMVE